MIETVQERQRGAYNFESYYDNLCALQDTCPIPAVKGHLHEGIFDINGDRIRQQDWTPIFNSIKINKSLKFISIRSYFQLNLENGIPEKKAKILRSRIPVIRTKEMTATLCKVLRDCLVTTENLECLELQGIHLRESDVTVIGQGLMKNSTLKHLSLESCRIGDTGLIVLCSAMKMAGNISTLNLTTCSLSPIGLRALGDLIKFQAMSRHNEAWKESLRYRWANFDTMCGIRRMTLNRNLGIGDEGALLLVESLKDDLWVKAIDMQECSLTNVSVHEFLKVLKYNSTLVVLDLRRNPMIDRDLLKSVTEQVLVNGDGKETEYKWLRVKDLMRNADENYDRHPRSYYNGPTKPLNHVSRPAFKPAGKLRSKSASSVDRKSNIYSEEHHNKMSMDNFRTNSARNLNNSAKGLPWRTAARAIKYKGYPPDHVPGKNNIEEHYEENDEFNKVEKFNKKLERVSQKNQLERRSVSKNRMLQNEQQGFVTTDDDQTSSVVSPLLNGTEQYPPMPKSIKDLRTEIFHLRAQLDKYQKDKSDIKLKLDEIFTENKRLRNTIKIMSRTNAVISERAEKSSILQNEAMLETIENSFKQFNAFLDMLRESGLGKIVTAAGMDQFSTTQDILQNITQPQMPKIKNRTKFPFHNQNDPNKEIICSSTFFEKDQKKIATMDENVKNDGHSSKSISEENQHSLRNSLSQDLCSQSHQQAIDDCKHSNRDENLESVGWKNNSNKSNHKLNDFVNPHSTGTSGDNFNELEKNINFEENNDPIERSNSPIKTNNDLSNDEQWNNDYFENLTSSASSIATNSKKTRATNESRPNYVVEDSTIVTESIENGMDNDVIVNNPFTNQLSLDTVQDISFDNSNLDMY